MYLILRHLIIYQISGSLVSQCMMYTLWQCPLDGYTPNDGYYTWWGNDRSLSRLIFVMTQISIQITQFLHQAHFHSLATSIIVHWKWFSYYDCTLWWARGYMHQTVKYRQLNPGIATLHGSCRDFLINRYYSGHSHYLNSTFRLLKK